MQFARRIAFMLVMPTPSNVINYTNRAPSAFEAKSWTSASWLRPSARSRAPDHRHPICLGTTDLRRAVGGTEGASPSASSTTRSSVASTSSTPPRCTRCPPDCETFGATEIHHRRWFAKNPGARQRWCWPRWPGLPRHGLDPRETDANLARCRDGRPPATTASKRPAAPGHRSHQIHWPERNVANPRRDLRSVEPARSAASAPSSRRWPAGEGGQGPRVGLSNETPPAWPSSSRRPSSTGLPRAATVQNPTRSPTARSTTGSTRRCTGCR